MEEKEPINARFTQWFELYFTDYLLMYKEGSMILLFLLKISLLYAQIYCCPVNFQTAQESFPKPFRIGLRGFIFKKQAP